MILAKNLALAALAVSICASSMAHAQNAKPAQAEQVTFPSVACTGQPVTCNKMAATGLLFAAADQKKIVVISHGSQGIDSRMYDYVDALRQAGIAALVLDHWGPRGMGVTHDDYAAADLRGGNNLNQAFDVLLATHWLRSRRGFERVGTMGESQGGATQVLINKKPIVALVKRNAERLYGKEYKLAPADASVGLYGYCGNRRVSEDVFYAMPFLYVTGAEDDEAPSKLCEQYVDWMNERGASAKISVIAGVGHSFDAPYARRFVNGEQFADCDLVIDDAAIRNAKTGDSMQNTPANYRAMMNKCRRKGFHTGYSGDRFVAVPVWTEFFRQKL